METKVLLEQAKKDIEPLLNEISKNMSVSISIGMFLSYLRLYKALRDYAEGKTEGGIYNLPETLSEHEHKITMENPRGLLCHHTGNVFPHFQSAIEYYCEKFQINKEKREVFSAWCAEVLKLCNE